MHRPRIATCLVAALFLLLPSAISAEVLDLEYSTYMGGAAADSGSSLVLDSARAVYVTGYVLSTDFPTASPYQASGPGGFCDVFVAKLSSSGTALLYSTYLGGAGSDYGYAIALDPGRQVYVTGKTESSSDFPVLNPYQSSLNAMDEAFLTALSSTGSFLLYSTYLGGESNDHGRSLAVDSLGQALLVGETCSNGFPTWNPYQASRFTSGEWDYLNDLAITKFSSTGSALLFSTYLGGGGGDSAYSVALDSLSRMYLTGFTSSTDFPVLNPYQSSLASEYNSNAFLCQLTSDCSALVYSTYFGGSVSEGGHAVAVDSAGQACVLGDTQSVDFPTLNPYQASNSGGVWTEEGFLTKFSSSGSALIFSTFFGGTDTDYGRGLKLDSGARPIAIGYTYSSDFPTVNCYQSCLGGPGYADAYAMIFSSSGSALLYSTYLGGGQEDIGLGLDLDPDNDMYLAGQSASNDFPTRNPYQPSRAGNTDATIVKLHVRGPSPTPSASPSPSATPTPSPLTPSPTATPTAAPTASPTPSPSPSPTPSASPSASPTATPIPTPTSSVTPSRTPTPSPSPSPTPSASPSGTPTPSPSPSRTPLPSPTPSPAPSVSPAPSATRSPAPSPAPSGTPSPVFSPSPSPSPLSSRNPWIHDYNGDGTSEVAIFRGSAGMWSVMNVTRLYFGSSTDGLVPGDYDGDGTTDIAIFRVNEGLWSIRNLSRFYLGSTADQPVPGDYDGDGVSEAGIFRPSAGLWSIRDLTRVYFGASDDTVIPGWYDDGPAKDIAVFRGSSGMWSVRDLTRFYFGSSTDYLVPGDYSGAGRWEAGIFRESAGLWSIRNVTRIYLGSTGDWALPADYDGDGIDDAGIFRDSAGMWSVRNLTRVYFGSTGDVPVTR